MIKWSLRPVELRWKGRAGGNRQEDGGAHRVPPPRFREELVSPARPGVGWGAGESPPCGAIVDEGNRGH